MISKARILVFAGLALPVAAFAQAPLLSVQAGASVDQRQVNQEMRIQQGVDSGALTAREAAKLERGQVGVQRMEARAAADGTVTPREENRLQRAEDLQSQKIFREKHDRQHDFNHDGRQDLPVIGRARHR